MVPVLPRLQCSFFIYLFFYFLTLFPKLFLTSRLRWNFKSFLGNVVQYLVLAPNHFRTSVFYVYDSSIHSGAPFFFVVAACTWRPLSCLHLSKTYLISVLSTFTISHLFETCSCCHGLFSVGLCIPWKARAGSLLQPKFLWALTRIGLDVM